MGLGALAFAITLGRVPPTYAHPHSHKKVSDAVAYGSAKPTDTQIAKRLKRVAKRWQQRQQKRTQRQRDRRRAIRKRLVKKLAGAPLTEAAKKELKVHAQRGAQLRQIRYVAATENDFESVKAVDKLLARENSRHEHWWRSLLTLDGDRRRPKRSKAAVGAKK